MALHNLQPKLLPVRVTSVPPGVVPFVGSILVRIGAVYPNLVKFDVRSPRTTAIVCSPPSPGGILTMSCVSVWDSAGRSTCESIVTNAEKRAGDAKLRPLIVRFAPTVGIPSKSARLRRRPPVRREEALNEMSDMEGGA